MKAHTKEIKPENQPAYFLAASIYFLLRYQRSVGKSAATLPAFRKSVLIQAESQFPLFFFFLNGYPNDSPVANDGGTRAEQ